MSGKTPECGVMRVQRCVYRGAYTKGNRIVEKLNISQSIYVATSTFETALSIDFFKCIPS